MPIDLVAVNLYPFQMTISQPGRVVRGRGREHRHRRPLDAPLRGQEPRVRAAGRGSDRLSQGARPAPAGRAHAGGAPGVRGQGVRAHRRLRRGHRRLPDAARGRPAPPARHRDGAGADAPLRREPRPARRAVRDRGAARHARPDPAPGQGALLQQPARHRRGHVGGGLLEQPAGLRRHQAHDAVRHRGGGLGRRGVPQGAGDRSGLRLRLGHRVQHGGGPRHRPGDERPLRRGRRGAVVPRRGAWPCSPRRRRCAWSSCP